MFCAVCMFVHAVCGRFYQGIKPVPAAIYESAPSKIVNTAFWSKLGLGLGLANPNPCTLAIVRP